MVLFYGKAARLLVFAMLALTGCAAVVIEGANIAKDQVVFANNIEAARNGDAAAQYAVGNSLCCALNESDDGFYNTPKAVDWLCQSAAQNHGPAAFRLGEIYSGDTVSGLRMMREAAHVVAGNTTNGPVAYAWMSRAATLGVRNATKERDDIFKNLSAEDRVKAQNLASGSATLLCRWNDVIR